MMSEKALLFKDLYHYGLIMESIPEEMQGFGAIGFRL
jgi:hypothetical protein